MALILAGAGITDIALAADLLDFDGACEALAPGKSPGLGWVRFLLAGWF